MTCIFRLLLCLVEKIFIRGAEVCGIRIEYLSEDTFYNPADCYYYFLRVGYESHTGSVLIGRLLVQIPGPNKVLSTAPFF